MELDTTVFGSLMQGCVSNISSHQFSESFSVRRSSCLFDDVGNGFWRDFRYIFRANLTNVLVLNSVTVPSICASKCSNTPGCIAFDLDGAGICSIKTGNVVYACDSKQPGCSAQQPGFYGASPGFYFADTDDLYCSPQSEDCACTREYYYCMNRGGCLSASDLDAYAQACADKGCTAPQCGMRTGVCNSTSRCNDQYLGCTATASASGIVGSSCFCIKNMTKCLNDSGCLFYNESSPLKKNSFAISANQIYSW